MSDRYRESSNQSRLAMKDACQSILARAKAERRDLNTEEAKLFDKLADAFDLQGELLNTKGRPGRQGYPAEVWDYAHEVKRNTGLKARLIWLECLKRFREPDLMPATPEAFRRFMNRPRPRTTLAMVSPRPGNIS